MASLFKIDIQKLKGVGPKTAEYFRKLGVCTIGDLIKFFPKGYEDWTTLSNIEMARGRKDKCLRLRILIPAKEFFTKSKKNMYKLIATDGINNIEITFFNNKYVAKSFRVNCEYIFRGNVVLNYGKYEMISPKFKEINSSENLYPIYHQTAGLTSAKIFSCIKNAFEMMPKTINETLPNWVIEDNYLYPLDFALKKIHFPKDKDELYEARKRIIFEEFFVYQLGVKLLKKQSRVKTDIIVKENYSSEFSSFLPFEMTHAQKTAVEECMNDILENKFSMNRLLQGDVGSGKTAVAASLAYTIAKNGYQVAIMAPTELLAVQHFNTFKKFFENTNLKIVSLYGSMKNKEKAQANSEILSGEANIVIGTHCLISEKVLFKNLGLIITDEQHRFGVNQRAALVNKGTAPHVLVMSATPIPRSLALILYGDLDISVLNETLPGRQKIDTFFVDSSKRSRLWNFLKNIINQGGQGYVVCASIEDTQENLLDVYTYYEKMIDEGFEKSSVSVLHGKMKSSEKDEIMKNFIDGKIKVLISTTVIEVGIDVPNAQIIIIENAERFGLSQLHQLRGRVGRSSLKSYCVLVSDSKSKDSMRRFSAMVDSNSGFYLSEEDLKLRGPGDFFGVNQHGVPNIKIPTDYDDLPTVKNAQNAALKFLSCDEISNYKFLNYRISKTFKKFEDEDNSGITF